MSLSSTTTRVAYAGNGVTTAFSFPYPFQSSTDLVVLSVSALGVETVLTLTTNYTVTGAGLDAGGTVTILVAPASGVSVVIYRSPTLTQDLDLKDNQVLPPLTMEKALDKQAMISQRLSTRVDRAMRLPEGYTGSFVPVLPAIITASRALVTDTLGTGLAMGPTSTEISNAQTYSLNAATSATNALASATGAASSASTAVISSSAASVSASAAGVSATTATSQATSATSSASTATTQATTATTGATTATAQAGIATTQATNAAGSATAAATSATNAAGSATAAATSATNAAGSATAAAGSATTLSGAVSAITTNTTNIATNTTNITALQTKTANVVAPSGPLAFEVASTTAGFIGPRMTTAQRDLIGSPIAGLELYNSTLSKKQIYSGTAWQDVGSGSGGGINYIANPDAETDTTGYATYADAAGVAPVDGTGGTANITFTRSTTTPLRSTASFLLTKDAVNRQGQGVSYDFTIASADKAKVLEIGFEYTVLSGTYVTGDVRVMVYDVTNAVLIEPSARDLTSVSIASKYKGTFQTASNSTSYRLILHVATVSTTAYGIQFDSVSVGPQVTTQGAFISDWTAWTPTGSWVTNATYTGQWRRVGGEMEGQIKVATTGAPTATALNVNLPAGATVDTARMPDFTQYKTALGTGGADDSGTTYSLYTSYFSTTAVAPLYQNAASGTASTITATAPFTFGASDFVTFNFKVPIVGWGTSQVLSSEAGDGRLESFRANRTTTQALSSGVTTTIIYPNVAWDDFGSYNSATGIYTFKKPGTYRVTASVDIQANATGLRSLDVSTTGQGGGTLGFNGAPSGGNVTVMSGSLPIRVVAGNTVNITAFQNGGALNASTSGAAYNYFAIESISSGSQQIAASETVACRYTSTAATAIAAGTTTIPFAIKSKDTHGEWNGTTYTAQSQGTREITAYFTTASVALTTSQDITLDVYDKNGVFYSRLGRIRGNGTTTSWTCNGTDSIEMLTSDTFTIRVGSDVATTMSTIAGLNRMVVKRTGNI